MIPGKENMEIPIDWQTQQNIKQLETDLSRFPKEFKNQQYEVMRVILPEHARSVGAGSVWAAERVAFQLLGSFPSKQKAAEYAEYVRTIQDWADIVVFDKYEWITLPPEQSIQELELAEQGEDGREIEFNRSNPILQKYCDALRKSSQEEQMIMQMRIEMARKGKDGAQDLATKEYSDWTNQQRITQMENIINNPSEYPEAMLKFAKEKLEELKSE